MKISFVVKLKKKFDLKLIRLPKLYLVLMKTLQIIEIPDSILNNHYLVCEIFSFSNVQERRKKDSYILELKLNKLIGQQKIKQINDDYIFKLSNGQVYSLQNYFYQMLLKDYDLYYNNLVKIFENMSKCQCCSRHCYGKPKKIDEPPSELVTVFSGCRSCKCRCRQTMRFINRAVFEYQDDFN